MSDSHTNSVFLQMSQGFGEDGSYVMRRAPAHDIPLIGHYRNGVSANAPVVVILHGYRGDPNGDNNTAFAEMVENMGFASVRISHAGFDHYGHDKAPESADTGTLFSNVEDVEHVFRAIGDERDIVILASSGSLNVAYAAGRNDERVSHIVAVSPFPDMYDFINRAKQRGQDDLDAQSYHIAERYGPRCKITNDWLNAGNPVSMSHKVGIMLAPHQPKMMVVRAMDDPIVNPNRSPFINGFLDSFHAAGYCVEDYVTPEKSHEPTPAIFDGVRKQLALVSQDIGFGSVIQQPVLTPQS